MRLLSAHLGGLVRSDSGVTGAERARPTQATKTSKALAATDTLEAPKKSNQKAAAQNESTPYENLLDAIQEGDVLEIAALIEEQPDAASRGALLNGPKGKQPPIFDAIEADMPQSVATLISLGANLNVVNNAGLSPVFVAATGESAATCVLLEREERLEQMTMPLFNLKSIQKVLDSVDKNTTGATLDALASKLTGEKTSFFNNTHQLQKLLMHTQGFSGDNPMGVDPEGWYFEPFLAARVRSLLDFVAHGKLTARQRTAIAKELWNAVTALRVTRRTEIAANYDGNAEGALVHHHVQHITRVLKNVPKGCAISIGSGWPGHAIYLSFTPDNQDIVMRLDNLGAGRSNHEREAENFKPIVLRFPKSALDDGTVLEHVNESIRALTVTGSDPEGDETFYGELEILKSELIARYGASVVKDQENAPGSRMQMAGNCVVENYKPGMVRRMGKALSQKFFDHETAYAAARAFENITPQALEIALKSNNERIERITKLVRKITEKNS